MRRSIVVVAMALATLSASAAAGAKDPNLPEGTWDLRTTNATYSGPATALRSALANLVRKRVTFSPACTQTVCSTYARVRTARGRFVSFVLTSRGGRPYTGRVTIATGLRCSGRALRASLTMTATLIRPQQDPGPRDRLTGTTARRAVNPGNCALFGGMERALRTTRFVGVAMSG